MDDVRSKKLEQIRKLLDKASDPGVSDAEADALRKKADDLMLAYTVEQWEIDQRKDKNVRQKPEKRHITVVGSGHPLKTQIVELFGIVYRHTRCRAVFSGLHDQKAGSTATAFGMPSDLDYLEMLFTSLQVQMAQNLEPKPNPHFSEEENLTLLKEAGLKWERIHQILYPDVPWERRHGVRYTKVYTDYCKATGRERMRSSPIQYQRNFAEGFNERVMMRLLEIKNAQKQESTGSGMELALRDIESEVSAAYNLEFGNARGVALAGRSKWDASARTSGHRAGDRADLGQQRVARTRELT